MTFEAAFKKLKEKFANVKPEMLDDMAIQITLSDEDCGGTFYAQVKDKSLYVEPYDYKDNDAVIDITRKALASILDGKSTFEKAVEKGEATVMGNIDKISAVKAAIVPPVKKPAVKKTTAAKKTTAKKEEPVKKAEAAKKAEPAKKAETVKKAESAKKAPAKKAEEAKKTTKTKK